MIRISKINKLFIAIILIFALTFISKINVINAASTTLSATNSTVKSGESFSVKITSSIKLSGWTVSLTNSDKCTFSSASGGETNGKAVYGTNMDGATSLATFNFKAPEVTKDTTYKITFSGTAMCDVSTAEVNDATCTAKITVKAKTTNNGSSGSSSGSSTGSSGSSSGSSNGNTAASKPNFTSVNKKVYTTNDVRLRSSWSTSSSAILVSAGTELTLTGTSKEIVNGYIWYRVTYNGATKYIASNFVSETKPSNVEAPETIKSSNANLDSLKIEKLTFSPSFSRDVQNYTATLEEDLTKLNVTAKAESDRAKVKIEGNENLKDGVNDIKITVTAEDGTTKTYTVKVSKGSEGENLAQPIESADTTDNSSLGLQSLEIKNVNFSDVFNPNEHFYELNLNLVVDNLDITAVANREDATIEILGNSNFEQGENLVTILVKSASEEETASYQIKVNLPMGVVQQQNEIKFYIKCVLIAFAVLLVVLIIILLSKKAKKKGNKADYINFEDTIQTAKMEDEYVDSKEDKKAEKEENSVDANDEFIDNIETTKKPKSSKGKHSV